MRTCVIFNPAAKGNKARHFRHELERIGAECALKPTGGPGDARRLAAVAVGEGFENVVAAGGDGTVNEVLNGIGDAPEGFARSRLGVMPLGTINALNGGGMGPEEPIPPPGGGRDGETWVDIPATTNGRTLHVRTVDTPTKGTPTPRELNVTSRVRNASPGDKVWLVPKENAGGSGSTTPPLFKEPEDEQ